MDVALKDKPPTTSSPEPVRLIIWDLDETFWRGTLTEGGISYVEAHHDLVIALAKRGIMSSICSKNDLAPIRERLTKEGLWDYFIFPSINWEPKGQRLKALVEAVQLRPQTIMFIDDNAMNRSEAAHFVPGLQIADETIIPSLLTSALCRGKDDTKLTRLAQYKLLETKQAEQTQAGDNREFLRASNIRVTIEHDLEPHMDRVIELINRTNQLNFTKQRLPEDKEQAREQLGKLLRHFESHAGLVHVQDRYGDYGFTGFYLVKSYAGSTRLLHFCFSCRTLGMGVETWLYERLGRPKLEVVGEVLTDLFAPHDPSDWINSEGGTVSSAGERLAGRIFMRGGCSMSSAAHYLALNADEVVSEFNINRAGKSVRLDHSLFLRYAFEGVPAATAEAWNLLGYEPSDFRSALADDPGSFDACILSFNVDTRFASYKHPNYLLPIPFYEAGSCFGDVRNELSGPNIYPPVVGPATVLATEEYIFQPPSDSLFSDNLIRILSGIPTEISLFFLFAPESYMNDQKQRVPHHEFIEQNRVIRARTSGRPNTHLMHVLDFVEKSSEQMGTDHFDRMVFFRFYQRIAETLRAKQAGASFPGAWQSELQPVIYLGDTHARYIAGAGERGLLGSRTVRGQMILGGTITPFSIPGIRVDALATFRKRLFGRNVDQIIVIQLGEADIAHVLWLAPAARRDVETEIDLAIEKYFNFVDEIYQAGFHYIVITAATLPTLNDDEQSRGVVKGRAASRASQRERTEATIAFNARLKREAEKRGLQYADITEDALDPVTKLARRSLRNENPAEFPMQIEIAAPLWAKHLKPCLEFYDRVAAAARAKGFLNDAPSNRLALPIAAKLPE